MTTKNPPRCKLCKENEKILIGEFNGTEFHFCPKCDRENKPTRG